MSEVQRILDQLQRAMEGNAWHGPSLMELLKGVTAEQAAAKPLGEAHSMWEIVLHVETWESAVRRRLLGESFEPSPHEDWRTVGDRSEEAWEAAIDKLRRSHHELRQTISKLKDSDLGKIVPGKSDNVYVMLHGVIQHDIYHAGQIAVLRKAPHS